MLSYWFSLPFFAMYVYTHCCKYLCACVFSFLAFLGKKQDIASLQNQTFVVDFLSAKPISNFVPAAKPTGQGMIDVVLLTVVVGEDHFGVSSKEVCLVHKRPVFISKHTSFLSRGRDINQSALSTNQTPQVNEQVLFLFSPTSLSGGKK